MLERKIEVLKIDKPTSLRGGVMTAINGVVTNYFRRLSPKKNWKRDC